MKTDKIMVGRGVTGRDICLGKWWKGKNDRGMSGEILVWESGGRDTCLRK